MGLNMIKTTRAITVFQRVLLAITVTLVAGCVRTSMESTPIEVHATATTIGTGWVYRSPQGSTERIQTGTSQLVGMRQMQYDSEYFQSFYEPGSAQVSLREDGAGPYILIALNDNATKRLHLYEGGPFSWDMSHLSKSVAKLVDAISTEDPRYSIHLLATRDEGRVGLSAETVAQIRLRRFADIWLQRAMDPRQLTGQVIPPTHSVKWKLAIALRPYQYGHEAANAQLIAPWTL